MLHSLCLNPRFVGQVFRQLRFIVEKAKAGLNPRFVGQVFRRKWWAEYVPHEGS